MAKTFVYNLYYNNGLITTSFQSNQAKAPTTQRPLTVPKQNHIRLLGEVKNRRNGQAHTYEIF